MLCLSVKNDFLPHWLRREALDTLSVNEKWLLSSEKRLRILRIKTGILYCRGWGKFTTSWFRLFLLSLSKESYLNALQAWRAGFIQSNKWKGGVDRFVRGCHWWHLVCEGLSFEISWDRTATMILRSGLSSISFRAISDKWLKFAASPYRKLFWFIVMRASTQNWTFLKLCSTNKVNCHSRSRELWTWVTCRRRGLQCFRQILYMISLLDLDLLPKNVSMPSASGRACTHHNK